MYEGEPLNEPRRLPTVAEQIAGNCRHFNGVMNRCCEAGVVYREARDDRGRGMDAFPCFRKNEAQLACPQRAWLTPEEVADEVRDLEIVAARAEALRAAGKCFECGADVEPRRQDGCCIYAACGHRMGCGVNLDGSEVDEVDMWFP